MVQRTLAPRRTSTPTTTAKTKSPLVGTTAPSASSSAATTGRSGAISEGLPRRPHYLDRAPRPVREPSSQSSPPVKIHTDDWMQVELPRTDYIQAGLVAILVAAVVSSITLLPAIVFFNWLALASVSTWAKLVAAAPISCGMLGAWSCLRRAKNERIRSRLLDELRN